MAETHSRACQLRWVASTWVLTIAMLGLYLIWLERPADVKGDLAIALFTVATSLMAVMVLARLPYFVVALVATTTAGFMTAYAVGSVTYGTEGELQNGLMFRAFGGAILGAASAISAWLVLRLAHRSLSRGTCPTTS
jgi:predicted membrane channel-forming protein YqfA (hemolysin III family)